MSNFSNYNKGVLNVVPTQMFKAVKVDITDFLPKYTYISQSCNCPILVTPPNILKVFPSEVRSFKSLTFRVPTLNVINSFTLENEDFIFSNNLYYKVISKTDNSHFGVIDYHCIEDYQIPNQTVSIDPTGRILCEVLRDNLNSDGTQNLNILYYNNNFKLPNDNQLYTVVAEGEMKPYENNLGYTQETSGLSETVATASTRVFDIFRMGRGQGYSTAVEEVLFALNKTDSLTQQERGKVKFKPLSESIKDLSTQEGGSTIFKKKISINVFQLNTYEGVVKPDQQFSTINIDRLLIRSS